MVQSKKRRSVTKSKSESGKQHDEQPSIARAAWIDDPAVQRQLTKEENFNEVEDYAIFLLDPVGKILSWNKGAEKIKGYSKEEIIGKNYRIFYTPEDKAEKLSARLLEEAKVKGRTVYEGWRVRKDGTRFWGHLALTALHTEDGKLRGFLKVTRDMTDMKTAEDKYSNFVEELKIANQELKRSEERYRKMVSEVTDYAIILLDKDGLVRDWNKGAEILKGYTAKEIIGKSFRMFHPREEKDAGLPEKLLAEASKNGSVTHEGWRIKKDGQRFWGNVAITALHDEHGEIIGYSKVTRDLTQKRIAEDRMSVIMEELQEANEELKLSEERYHRMIAEVQDYAIILLNKNGDVQNWNAGAEVIKGYKASEIVGKNFRVFYPEEDRRNNLPEKFLRMAVEQGRASYEGWRVRKDGSQFWGSIVITALHNSKGEVIGFSKVTRDLTELKNSQDQLKQNAAQLDLKNKTLERLNEELSSFTHVASHDMKEPLRKILTYAGRIESAKFEPDKSRDFLEKIKTSAAGMRNLIEDLLSYSQVSNDNSSKFEKVDLNKVLQAVTTDLEIAIAEKHAVIDVERLPIVHGIAYQLQQLFLNLLSNAVKFSRPEEPPYIVIRAELIKGPDIPGDQKQGNNKYHHITVTDNGIGFSHQHSDKIFEAFQRLHPRTTFSGTGIGLAIVKKIIDNHNGIVSAEGNPGAGAVFHVYLPVV